jgi:hypothetical protein
MHIRTSSLSVAFSRLLILLTIPLLAATSGCDEKKKSDVNAMQLPAQSTVAFNPYKDAKLTVEVFKIDSIEHNGYHGWGYDILVDGKIYIHQPNIPAIMGNNGFSSEENAQEAGEFIIQKLKNNIIPPSVTPEELDSLGVLN